MKIMKIISRYYSKRNKLQSSCLIHFHGYTNTVVSPVVYFKYGEWYQIDFLNFTQTQSGFQIDIQNLRFLTASHWSKFENRC